VNKNQWITAVAGIILVILLFQFGRTVPVKKLIPADSTGNQPHPLSIDTLLTHAKEVLGPEQLIRLNELENSISRGNVKTQRLEVYHQLAHFWSDSAHIFEPYAWYIAEAARLENSEKSLTFAAHLFLENLRLEGNPELKYWKSLQAKELFERSLKINPHNDSARVGLGAVYIFGNISATPMEGISKILQVAKEDSSNIYALMMLGHASVISGQYDKAIDRFEAVLRMDPTNLEAILLLAEAYERKGDKLAAVGWYQKSLPLIKTIEVRKEVGARIDELKKIE
jgi:tetratricopeptide (TPR) repeat protein